MTSPSRLTDRKRDAIIQAAIAEFRANGFEATSVDKVAARAEVSKRTLYNHFASKDELFAAILDILWESSASEPRRAYEPRRPVREQLIELLQSKLAMLADDNFLALARVAIAAALHSPERAREMVDRIGQKDNAMLDWIRAAQKHGALKAGDAAQAYKQLECLVKGVAFWPQLAMGQPRLTPAAQKKLAAASADLFLSHYGV
ncbi:TetR/AcrR family transcriptional regulator [Bordetella sp. FB-8]|uniref:TetR/AcrR family transcriptional regulator n=1 Tax=Bordetella sp. FB-8 TaxID=1159870 RepID=UPI0003689B7A|nr:TetR/AcrR family transcriptional regulator [Bordetella sp. FB-8]